MPVPLASAGPVPLFAAVVRAASARVTHSSPMMDFPLLVTVMGPTKVSMVAELNVIRVLTLVGYSYPS